MHEVVEGVDGVEVVAVAHDGRAGWWLGRRRCRVWLVLDADCVRVGLDGDEAEAGLVLRALGRFVVSLVLVLVLSAASGFSVLSFGKQENRTWVSILTTPSSLGLENSREVLKIQMINRSPPARTIVLTWRREP